MKTETLPSLPATYHADGFNTPDHETVGRLGQGSFIKFGTDAVWRTSDGQALPPDFRAIAMATTRAAQLWRDKRPVETIIEAPGVVLPDIDALNSKISKKTWERGPDGEARPPWQLQRVLYLLSPADASKYTFASSTVGAAIALSNLKERINAMRRIRNNEDIYAIVELASAPFRTRYGVKTRPEFKIVNWCSFGSDAALAQIGGPKTVEPATLREELNDDVPY